MKKLKRILKSLKKYYRFTIEAISKLLKQIKKHYVFSVVVGVFVLLSTLAITNLWGIVERFWGSSAEVPSPFTIVSFIGLCCGGLILLFQVHENSRRNRIMEKGQLDTMSGRKKSHFFKIYFFEIQLITFAYLVGFDYLCILIIK